MSRTALMVPALAALLAGMPAAWAGEGTPSAPGSSAPSADPINGEIAAVIDLFYDIQPEAALAAVRPIEARHPGHPAGAFYRAMVYYERSLFQDPVRPETLAGFETAIQRCLDLSEALLVKGGGKSVPGDSSRDALGHYYLGAGHGFRARVRAHQGRMREALADAKKAMRSLKAAVEADPGLEDAYLGLGMYNYFTSRLPAAAKPFAFMLTGMWPNRQRGLEQIRRTAEKGVLARVEARTVLAAAFSSEREKRWDEAESILAPLMERYPRNPYFRLRRVYIAEKTGRWDDVLRLSDPDGAWVQALDPEIRPGALASVRYRAAEALILSDRPEAARPLLEALRDGPCPSRLKPWLAVRIANLLQAEGLHGEAAGLFEAVSEETARKTADGFVKEPYPKGPRTVAPLRWPLSEVPR